MRTTGSEATNKSLEMDIERNVHDLSRVSATVRQPEDGDDEMSANRLDTLLGLVSESSRREIENLIDELQTYHNKLQAGRGRIHRDIVEYTGLSQRVMHVTTIISDSVKNLPMSPGVSR
jgi:hypothetical protein